MARREPGGRLRNQIETATGDGGNQAAQRSGVGEPYGSTWAEVQRNGSRTSMDNGCRFAVRSLVKDPGAKEEMATHTKRTHTGGIIDEETVTLRISLLNLEAVRLGDIPADMDRLWGQPTLVQHLGRRKPFQPCGQMVA